MNNENLKNSIFSGVIWKFAERILAQGVSFIVSVVLARILMPSDYGIVALILVFINIANVFVTSGFSTALVQNKEANNIDFSTNFYCSLFISILVYLVLFIAAPYIENFYNMEGLTIILRIFALRIPLSAYSAIQHAYVERHMIFKRYFFSTLGGTLISGVVGIFMAYKGFGAWALIAQYFTNTIVDILVLSFTVPWHPELCFSWKSAKSMMNYGWKILAADLSGTFFDQLRSLIVGKAYTSADLAYYNKGNQLPSLITTNISTSIMSVLFPAIANISDEKARVKEMTRKAVKIMSFVMFPMLFGLAAVAGPLVNFLFTEKWGAAVPFIQILSVSSAISLIGGVSLQAIKAIGRSDIILKLEIYKKPVYVLLLIVGVKINVIAVAVTMLLYSIYGNIVNAKPLKNEIGYSYKEQIIDLCPAFLLSIFMSFFVYITSYLKLKTIFLLILQVVIGIVLYVAMALLFKVDTLKYLQNFLKKKLKGEFEMMEKVIDALKNGVFIWKLKQKLRGFIRKNNNIIQIKSKDAKTIAYQYKDYSKLYIKYKNIIDKGVEKPLVHEHSNKVWVCWFQGYESAPQLVKACINSMHKVMPEKEIIILTTNNLKEYIQLPAYVEEKFKKGKIGMAHYSDLLRVSLLAKWGGMWIDSTALCTDENFFKYADKQDLFVFKQLNLGTQEESPIIASSWFISSEIGNPIITLTRNLLYEYWKDYDYLLNYFTFHLFFTMACRRYKEEWDNVPTFNNNSPHVLMFELKNNYSSARWKQLIEMSGIHKLQRYDDFSNLKNSNYSKIIDTYLL